MECLGIPWGNKKGLGIGFWLGTGVMSLINLFCSIAFDKNYYTARYSLVMFFSRAIFIRNMCFFAQMRIKAIILDLDNTLLDFLKMKRICCDAAIDAMIRAGLKMGKRQAITELDKIYKFNIEDGQIFQKFLLKVKKKIDYRILCCGINAYRRARFTSQRPYPYVKSTLKALKKRGYKLAILSDAPKLKAFLRLTAMDLQDYFDVIVTFDDTKARKPSRRAFSCVLEKLNVKPAECLMVGDWVERDILGAKKAGMMSCFAKYGSRSSKSDADFEIEDFRDLLKIV